MRESDWSSDVCSSDLAASLLGDYRFDIVCGPLMDEEKVALMDRKASGLANTRLLRSVHNLKETIAGYDLVVCSGGYNTLLETIVRRKRCIAVPRRGSYEQGRRIRLFSAKGLLVPVSESRLTPSVLSELIGQALHGAYVPCVTVNTDGLKNTIAAVRRCLSPAECLFGPDGTALPA
jgi:predicted glycosyltransferase